MSKTEQTVTVEQLQKAMNLLQTGDENNALMSVKDFKDTLDYLYKTVSTFYIEISQYIDPAEITRPKELSLHLYYIDSFAKNIGKALTAEDDSRKSANSKPRSNDD